MLEAIGGDAEKIKQWNRNYDMVYRGRGPDLSESNDPWDARGIKLSEGKIGVLLHNAKLSHAKFCGASLSACNFQYSELHGCDFQNADLSRANLDHIVMDRGLLEGAKLDGARITECEISRSCFVNASVQSVSFKYAQMRGCDFSGTDLSHGDLEDTKLTATLLYNTNCTGANFRNSDLSYCDLRSANFTSADLQSVKLQHRDRALPPLKGRALHHRNIDERGLVVQYPPSTITWRDQLRSLHKTWCSQWRGFKDGNLREWWRCASQDFITVFKNRKQRLLPGISFLNRIVVAHHTSVFDNADLRNAHGFVAHGQSVQGTRFSPKSNDPYSIIRSEYTGPMMFFHFAALTIFFTPLVIRTAFWVSTGRLEQLANSDITRFTNSRRVISLVMGAEQGAMLGGWLPAIPAFVMLFYNILRVWITWWLSRVRDVEERSQHLPMVEDYWWCYLLHKYFMRIVFWLALASFLLSIVRWMSMSVYVPS
tara:strand:+ start:291 stop:1736 length:1446 start_codon:yes stop_codon:yes gene_type:complete